MLGPPVQRVQASQAAAYDGDTWPYCLPAVRQLLDGGLDLDLGVTFLVGENGSGKSTLVEAIAMAYGLAPEGGSRHVTHRTRDTESPLAEALHLVRTPGRADWAYFLRAETMHGLLSYLEDNEGAVREDLHGLSHGEAFLEVFGSRVRGDGFFVLDEPESALSFRSTLALVAALDDLRREGAQVLVATHSPLLASLPGATILEIGDHGIRAVTWEDLDLVQDWRGYLADPGRWLQHLLTD